MIKLNLATKPGLQPFEIQDPQITNPLVTAPPSGQDLESATAPLEELLKSAEKQLETIEQQEEFVPRHVSLPPQAKKPKTEEKPEAEEIIAAASGGKPQRSRKVGIILIGIILLGMLALGGWLSYQYFTKGAINWTFLQHSWAKLKNITGRKASQPEEEAVSTPTVDTLGLGVTDTLSTETAQQVLESSYYVERFCRLLDYFPAGTRFQRVKLNVNRIMFIALLSSDSAVVQLRNRIFSSGDYETPEVFQSETVPEGKQLLGVIQIKTPSINIIPALPAYSDATINQKVWDLGRKVPIKLEPLTLYQSDPNAAHEVEVNASGAVQDCGQFLRFLVGANLNWSIGMVALSTADLDKIPSTQITLNLKAVIYPPQP